jgi:hypothetical protein
MSDLNELIQTILTYYKSILAIAASVLICLTTTSCACGGGGCSIGGTETHQILNQRLLNARFSNSEVQQWEK